eukprot:TRINITY_DN2541_c0_g1_i1.p1 TRINITY_DN2541_c0_g1~~TRINITY_DN2541_c0_g1_i1.p1  ORF type:complete len:444 (-),score=80.52 TRINITY_DN2541_c0_g1_i1:74-1405(-)
MSGSTLTKRQKQALHSAVVGYLYTQNFTSSLDAFVEESGVSLESVKGNKSKLDMLEKKWNTIIRQQRKISELEKQCQQLEDKVAELSSGGGRGRRDANKNKKRIIEMPAKFTLNGHRGNINVVKFHPTFGVLVSAGEDCQLKIWDWESGSYEKGLKGHTLAIQDLAFDVTGKILASCSNDLTIKLWNFGDYSNETRATKTLHGHDHSVSGVRFSGDGKFLFSCSRDKTIKVWDIGTGYCVGTTIGSSEWVKQIRLDASDTLLGSCGHDFMVKVWKIQNVSSGTLVLQNELRGHEHVVESIDFSPRNCILNKKQTKRRKKKKKGETADQAEQYPADVVPSEYIVSGSRDKSIKIWELATGNEVMELLGHDNWVKCVKFHPDGKHIISCGDDWSVRFWSLEQKRCVKEIKAAHEHFVQALDWWNEGGRDVMATGGVDDVVKIWED